MLGIIPAAGQGSRMQPLAFSKELLPVGSRLEDGVERPRAVSEYVIERMIRAGVDRVCFVISPRRSDLLEYYGAHAGSADAFYVVQPEPVGLCDAVFRALPFLGPGEECCIGLPDTVWFPEDGLSRLPRDTLSFLLFPVAAPELFDAVVSDDEGRVQVIDVKRSQPRSRWIWGAMRMRGELLHTLHALWVERDCVDLYLGTLVNAYLDRGGAAVAVRAGEAYVDVGTLHGYRQAIELLARPRTVTPSLLEVGSNA